MDTLDVLILSSVICLLVFSALKCKSQSALEAHIQRLKVKWYCKYAVHEKLTPHSFKLAVQDGTTKLMVCDALNVFVVYTYIEGQLQGEERFEITAPEDAPSTPGTPTEDLPSPECR